jgi:deoxyribonuclease V
MVVRAAPMFAAVDVFYDEHEQMARAACILFRDPRTDDVAEEAIATVTSIAAYEPGRFYQRELPCIEAVLGPRLGRVDTLLIDGYVWLSSDQRPGLGWHVHQHLKVPVIGVAKTRFKDADCFAEIVLRGSSKTPLYVTQIGYQGSAGEMVRQMHGANRIPTLLRRVDRLARVGV